MSLKNASVFELPAAAKLFISEQDREIASKSGVPALAIKSVWRSIRRYAGRSRADLRCEPSHDIEVAAAPFRARKRGRRIKAKPLGHRQHR